jgi:hypothetical protein
MALDATSRRRRFGVVVLSAALILLIAGETVLKDRLGRVGFILYWMACFICTGLAILVALVDARVLKSKVREEQRDLVKDILKEIEADAKTKPRRETK